MTLKMFRKLGLSFLAANAIVLAASAQKVEFGIKGGLNVSEMLTSKNQYIYTGGNMEGLKNYPRTALNAGVFVSIKLPKKFTLQPELVYSQQGANGEPSINYLVNATENYKYNFINVPVLLKYNTPVGVFAETGPQFGYLLSAKIDETVVGATHTNKYSVKDQYKSTDIGWVLGVGYTSPFNLGFDIRYNLGLTNYSNVTAAGMQSAPVQNGNLKNGVLQIGVFYIFGKVKAPPADQP